MAKKLETTPEGMICRKCGQDKAPYNFFKPFGKFEREFFANGKPDGHTCFDCAGPYICLGCGETKPASAYRIQGRYCDDCRAEGNTSQNVLKFAAVDSERPTNSNEGGKYLVSGHEGNES